MRLFRIMIFLMAITIAWFVPSALAQNEDPAAPPPMPPIDAKPAVSADEDVPIPPKVQDESSRAESTVEIKRDDKDNIIEEYSLDGRVYMVKVTPKFGPAYYYLDDNGDGQLELQERDKVRSPVKPVYWKVKEWR